MSAPFDAVSADVLVIGGGPAGLSAATRLRTLGVEKVVVAEREPRAGGVPRHCGHPPFGMWEFGRVLTGPVYARRLVERAVGAGVEVMPGCSVVAIDHADDVIVTCTTGRGPRTIIAKRVIIATGVREKPRSARLVSGDRPIGVLNTGALQEYVYLQNLAPFRHPIIVGTELVALSSLLTCRKIGIRPAAMIENRARPTVRRLSMALPRLLGVPVRYGAHIAEIKGRQRVEAVTLISGDGTLDDVACDGVLFTGDFRPESALARSAGLEIDDGTGGPAVDQFARTSASRIFAAGNILHPVETAGWSWREGRRIGEFVARDLKGDLPSPLGAIRLEPGPGIRYVVPQRLVAGEGGLDHLQMRLKGDFSGDLVASSGEKIIREQPLTSGPERRILAPLSAFTAADEDITFDLRGRFSEPARSN